MVSGVRHKWIFFRHIFEICKRFKNRNLKSARGQNDFTLRGFLKGLLMWLPIVTRLYQFCNALKSKKVI